MLSTCHGADFCFRNITAQHHPAGAVRAGSLIGAGGVDLVAVGMARTPLMWGGVQIGMVDSKRVNGLRYRSTASPRGPWRFFATMAVTS